MRFVPNICCAAAISVAPRCSLALLHHHLCSKTRVTSIIEKDLLCSNVTVRAPPKNSTRRLNFYVYKESPVVGDVLGQISEEEGPESISFSFFFPELFFRLTLLLLHEFTQATELTAVRSVGRGEAQHQALYIKVGQRAHREHQ